MAPSGRWPTQPQPPAPSGFQPRQPRPVPGWGRGLVRAPPPRIATAPWREGRLWWQRRLGDKSRRNGKKYTKQNALFQAGTFVTHFEGCSLISEDFPQTPSSLLSSTTAKRKALAAGGGGSMAFVLRDTYFRG
ncbi:uncharacterized protein V3H86_003894 [Mergus octosetaceus]